MTLLLLALSPWNVPVVPASSPEDDRGRVEMVCTDAGTRPQWEPASRPLVLAPLPQSPTTTEPAAVGAQGMQDIKAARIERGPSGEALMAVGGTMRVAGALMQASAPPYIDIDHNDGPMMRVRSGYSSGTHTTEQMAVGIGGTLLRALGATLTQLGAKKKRDR